MPRPNNVCEAARDAEGKQDESMLKAALHIEDPGLALPVVARALRRTWGYRDARMVGA
jgi:hypothetical protein